MRNTPFDYTDLVGLQLWQQEDAEDNDQRRRRLRHNLTVLMERELTPRQRDTVELFFFQKMRITDIAREMGLSKSTVSRTLQRALKRLYRYLQYTY